MQWSRNRKEEIAQAVKGQEQAYKDGLFLKKKRYRLRPMRQRTESKCKTSDGVCRTSEEQKCRKMNKKQEQGGREMLCLPRFVSLLCQPSASRFVCWMGFVNGGVGGCLGIYM